MSRLPGWLNLPQSAPCRVVHSKREKGDIYIGRGAPFGNPFPMHTEAERPVVVERFREWIKGQPELLRLARQVMPGKSLGCFCAPEACHGDVYAEIANGEWDALIPDEPVFVFGSNLAGRHGKGAALDAKRQYGAVYGIGQGLTGRAYALPTKDGDLNVLGLDRVLYEIDRLIDQAKQTPAIQYRMTRVGCGLAGLSEDLIAERLLRDAPSNILLPGVWELRRSPGLARVVVAGTREIDDYDFLCAKLDRLLSRLTDIEIVSGGARGPDTMGERYAVERGLRLRRMPAYWDSFGKAAGGIRNRRMSWYGTHLIALWDQKSTGTLNMIESARQDGLGCRVLTAA